MGEVVHHDEVGHPYTVRNGVPVWLPEAVYLDHEGNAYTERQGAWAWLESGRAAASLAPSPDLREPHDGLGSLSATYDCSVADISQMVEYYYRQGPGRLSNRPLLIPVILLVPILVLLATWSALDGEANVAAFFAGFVLPFAILLSGAFIGVRKVPRRSAERILHDAYSRSTALGSKTVTIAPQGVVLTSPMAITSKAWPLVRDVVVHGDALYIYSGDAAVAWVPARAFESHDLFDEFCALAIRYARGFPHGTASTDSDTGTA